MNLIQKAIKKMNRIKEGFEYLDKFEKYVKEDRKE